MRVCGLDPWSVGSWTCPQSAPYVKTRCEALAMVNWITSHREAGTSDPRTYGTDKPRAANYLSYYVYNNLME